MQPSPGLAGAHRLIQAASTTDQRFLPRPTEAGCEIGSVELQAAPIVVVVTPKFTG